MPFRICRSTMSRGALPGRNPGKGRFPLESFVIVSKVSSTFWLRFDPHKLFAGGQVFDRYIHKQIFPSSADKIQGKSGLQVFRRSRAGNVTAAERLLKPVKTNYTPLASARPVQPERCKPSSLGSADRLGDPAIDTAAPGEQAIRTGSRSRNPRRW